MNQKDYNPLVSVGIPTFNRPYGLRKLLFCITQQSYKNIEIIISDNCSPGEETDIIIKEFMKTDPRIRFFKQSENKGAVFNFKFVLGKAIGDFFFWASDDDLFEKNYITQLLSFFSKTPDVVLCTCDTKVVDEKNIFLKIEKLKSLRLHTEWKKTRVLFFSFPISNVYLSIYGLYKTSILKNHGINLTEGWNGLVAGIEVPFLAKIALMGRIASIPLPLKTYKRHPDSAYFKEFNKTSRLNTYILRMQIRKNLLLIINKSNLSFSEKKPLYKNVIKSIFCNLFPTHRIKLYISLLQKYFITHRTGS